MAKKEKKEKVEKKSGVTIEALEKRVNDCEAKLRKNKENHQRLMKRTVGKAPWLSDKGKVGSARIGVLALIALVASVTFVIGAGQIADWSNTQNGTVRINRDSVGVNSIDCDKIQADSDVTVGGDLDVTGDVTAANLTTTTDTITGDLDIAGDVTIASNLTVTATIDVTGTTTLGAATISGVVSATNASVSFLNLPTATTGLASGRVWLNSNVLTIVP